MSDTQKQEIGQRLWQERTRFGLTQAEMATRGGVGFSTYTAYEKGKSTPDAVALHNWATHGVDVLFVVTGTQGTGGAMPPEELTLLGQWRESPEALRQGVVALFRAYREVVAGGGNASGH